MSPAADVSPDVAALADDLATVLVDGVADDARSRRVDDAMADALEALEALRPDDLLGPPDADLVEVIAATVVQVAVELRHGRLDRSAARAVAPLVLERVARAYGTTGPVEPLLVLLAALGALPDHPDAPTSAVDPTPDPDRPVEVALATFLADPDGRTAWLDSLADATLHVPVLHAEVGDEHLALRLLPLVLREGPVACAFTSPERFAELVREAGVPDTALLELAGAELVDVWPVGHGLALNPGSVLGTVVAERDVRALPSRRRQAYQRLR